MIDEARIEQVVTKLMKYIELEEYRGWDPYDALNSPFLRFFASRNKWLRIACIQLMKRSPLNLRSLLGVAKTRNPKAMGLLAQAYLVRYKATRWEEYLTKAQEILDWLITHSTGESGYAWGYNFDWQSRTFFVARGTPTVVNTCFIAQAFLDAYEITQEENYLEIARSSCDFIMNDLQRTPLQSLAKGIEHRARSIEQSAKNIDDNASSIVVESSNRSPDFSHRASFCFSYTPFDTSCVHNANMLAAELLARVYTITGKKGLHASALDATKFTISMQNPDGSWFYGIGDGQEYIDSFHTGFLLGSLRNVVTALNYGDDVRYKEILSRGYEYYKKTFFEDFGMPHYRNDSIYPLDLHCSAQGILTLCALRDFDDKALYLSRRIAEWTIDNMWDASKGYFYFQKTLYYINRVPYLRWPNAWMFLALSVLIRHIVNAPGQA